MQQCQVSQNGVTLGHIIQHIHFCFTHYSILESQGREIFQVVPPGCANGNIWAPILDFILCSRDAFEVYSVERNAVIGNVSKSVWHFPQTRSQHRVIFEPIIGIDFPKHLTVTHKALLLACLFLLVSICKKNLVLVKMSNVRKYFLFQEFTHFHQ